MSKFDHIKSHVFGGKRYRIKWRRPRPQDDGECDHPSEKNKTICIAPSLSEADLLETIIHESIHAVNFPIDEDHVDQWAEDISRFLLRVGFRLPSE